MERKCVINARGTEKLNFFTKIALRFIADTIEKAEN